jgi:hypothetical protein
MRSSHAPLISLNKTFAANEGEKSSAAGSTCDSVFQSSTPAAGSYGYDQL